MLMFLDPKIHIETTTVWWIIGGITSGITIIVGTVTKIMTKNHISRKEAFKTFQTEKMCGERSGNIEEKIDNLQTNMNNRFDDLKTLIVKNSK